MTATMLMTSYNRIELLENTLASIRVYSDIDILILDDANNSITEKIASKMGCRYFCTRKINHKWRIPGYALNIGLKKIDSDIVFITSEDVKHVSNCIDPMLKVLENDPKAMARTKGKNETKPGRFKKLKTEYPFLMGFRRQELIDIGGYDEDFIGIGYDDADLVDRLLLNGCHYVMCNGCEVLHQYHCRLCHREQKDNCRLYRQRRGTVNRNVGKDWGVLC